MPIKCSCGHDNPDGTDFCTECGADLAGAAPPASPQPPGPAVVPPAPPQVAPQPVPPQTPPAAAQMTAKAKLTGKRYGAPTSEEFPIMGSDVFIGRSDPDTGVFADIDLSMLPEKDYVSRRHARIYQKEGQWYIEDQGSTNGTYINRGPRLTAPQPLKDGDEIMMGRAYFIFKTG